MGAPPLKFAAEGCFRFELLLPTRLPPPPALVRTLLLREPLPELAPPPRLFVTEERLLTPLPEEEPAERPDVLRFWLPEVTVERDPEAEDLDVPSLRLTVEEVVRLLSELPDAVLPLDRVEVLRETEPLERELLPE